jgi:hypothetical protein
MRLTEILEIIKNTELKQIIVGDDDSQVYSLLNLALIDVYGRFDILQEEQLITMRADQTMYRLLDKSQRLLRVYGKWHRDQDPERIQDLPINDDNDPRSVFTPQPYILHVPNPIDGQLLSCVLSVTPPYITPQNIDTLDLIVPPQFLECITSYMGYRAYLSVNGDQQYEHTSLYQRYLRACNDVRVRGLTHFSIATNRKALDRGFPAGSGDINTDITGDIA